MWADGPTHTRHKHNRQKKTVGGTELTVWTLMKQLVVSIVGGKVNFLFFISIYLFIYYVFYPYILIGPVNGNVCFWKVQIWVALKKHVLFQ